MSTQALRYQILAALTAVSCGGEIAPTPGTSSSGASTSGSSGTSGTTSSSSSNSGGTTSGSPSTCSGTARRNCYEPDLIPTYNTGVGGVPAGDAGGKTPTRDANRCVVQEETIETCCNPATSGPVFEGGKCCYEFCVTSCCGRPLVVEGCARIAIAAARGDWALSGGWVDRLEVPADEPTRRAIAEAWARAGLEEHASVASFAAFTLDLLALGAPPELVSAAQTAGLDEVSHARVSFAIAARYAATPIGPGPLDLAGLSLGGDLARAAAATVRDGCINETFASALASHQASNVTHPDLRAALERIAQDEADHATLAWSFVKWALAVGGPAVHAAVASAFDAESRRGAARADHEASLAAVDSAAYRAAGLLAEEERRAVWEAAWTQVITPCQATLGIALAPSVASAFA